MEGPEVHSSLILCGFTEGYGWCQRRDLNPRPKAYESSALPLSYSGDGDTLPDSGCPASSESGRGFLGAGSMGKVRAKAAEYAARYTHLLLRRGGGADSSVRSGMSVAAPATPGASSSIGAAWWSPPRFVPLRWSLARRLGALVTIDMSLLTELEPPPVRRKTLVSGGRNMPHSTRCATKAPASGLAKRLEAAREPHRSPSLASPYAHRR